MATRGVSLSTRAGLLVSQVFRMGRAAGVPAGRAAAPRQVLDAVDDGIVLAEAPLMAVLARRVDVVVSLAEVHVADGRPREPLKPVQLAECDENTCRKNFTPSEAVAG
jgi:hypothetical protein